MRDIDLIAVDLDGTLLRGDSSLAPEGRRLLRAAADRGVRVILSTTRTPSSVRGFSREMGLAHPMICTNGAEIWASPEGPVWVIRELSMEVARAVAELADARGWSLITTVREITYTHRQAGQPLGPVAPHRAVVARNVDPLREGAPTRILSYQPEAIAAVRALCAKRFAGSYHLETYYYPDGRLKSLGLYAPGSDKGTALQEVYRRLGVDAAATLAIGDNPNDLPMFAVARWRVAMGNATSDVKAAADVVAPPNDAEGVAWAVRCIVLNERGSFVPSGEMNFITRT